MGTLSAILEVGRAFARERDPEGLLHLIVEKAVEVSGAERGCIALPAGEALVPRATMGLRAEEGARLSSTAARRVLAQGMPMAWEDLRADPALGRAASVRAQRLRTVMCAPLVVAGRVLGVLYVDASTRGSYSREDLDLFQALANQAAVAMENTRLYQESISDALTGLFGAGYFYRRLGDEVQRARRYGHPLGLVLADLNGLKAINDTHGHLAGNRALLALAGMLRSQIRASDVACRYGGDEFAVILPEAGWSEGRALLARLEERARAVRPEEVAGWRGASFGLAVYPQDGDAAEALIAAADGRVYAGKEGSNQNLLNSPRFHATIAIVGTPAPQPARRAYKPKGAGVL